MIERLINLERPYGEPEYNKLVAESARLKGLLSEQLDGEGKG